MKPYNYILNELKSEMDELELAAIVEAARIALADTKIAKKVGEAMGLSDADINNLQHKCQIMLSDEASPDPNPENGDEAGA